MGGSVFIDTRPFSNAIGSGEWLLLPSNWLVSKHVARLWKILGSFCPEYPILPRQDPPPPKKKWKFGQDLGLLSFTLGNLEF